MTALHGHAKKKACKPSHLKRRLRIERHSQTMPKHSFVSAFNAEAGLKKSAAHDGADIASPYCTKTPCLASAGRRPFRTFYHNPFSSFGTPRWLLRLPCKGMILLAAVTVLLAACDSTPDAPLTTQLQSGQVTSAAADTTETAVESTTGWTIPADLPPVDYDLSTLSRTMMYSQVYDMIYGPDAYIGKTVRMTGPVNMYTDEQTGKLHCACIIEDATACCTQGIEFELKDPDAKLPESGSRVLVRGTFDTYMQDMFLFCVLRNAVLEAG